ncbi:ATP-dependent RNA helicase RhlE [Pedobacter psychrotolerans]|uniref:ATP-dependent RNA helicase RhlE n=2 Tax=Pedobacter psychrotolerans TaxID=1843235 RepID=A0A4R2H8E9_9SPHI|nr:DEAD/DEAH box helicase [Pedobacter psychrotolerans]TCO22491.1 ATP-dependent RNA helicase RhlE [Pedobacter psychrotolerans]
MSLDKLKLSKPLVAAMTDAGFLTPKEIQLKTMSRILGGQDVIAVGPEGSGKTTTYVLATLMKLKYAFEEAPRALILVPDVEHVDHVLEQFKLLNRNKTFRILGIDSRGAVDTQMNEITDGCDIIVAVPDRARALYLKLALNTNKIQLFIVDNAELIVKKGLQLPVVELANSAYKSQHVVFTEVMHEKLNLMISPFMKDSTTTIEVDEIGEKQAEVYQQMLYQVPNFRTKLNLLTLLMNDTEFFDKVVVFVNTRLTAQTVYKNFNHSNDEEYTIYRSLFFDDKGYDDIEDFKSNPNSRVLIVANENLDELDIQGIPFIIHFELPEQKETLIQRIIKHEDEEVVAITFSTDIELIEVKKIEQAIGQRMEAMELPEDLKIVDPTAKPKKKKGDDDEDQSERGAAFHEKKASNLKNYNYSAGTKAKMTYKNKKGLS